MFEMMMMMVVIIVNHGMVTFQTHFSLYISVMQPASEACSARLKGEAKSDNLY